MGLPPPVKQTPHQDGVAFLKAVHKAIEYGGPLTAVSPSETLNTAAEQLLYCWATLLTCSGARRLTLRLRGK
jgi:hypothetical protein